MSSIPYSVRSSRANLPKVYGWAALSVQEQALASTYTLGTIQLFTTKTEEPTGMFSNGVGGTGFRIIIPRDGVFKITCASVAKTNSSGSTGFMLLEMLHNGSKISRNDSYGAQGRTLIPIAIVSAIKGDVFTFASYSSTGNPRFEGINAVSGASLTNILIENVD